MPLTLTFRCRHCMELVDRRATAHERHILGHSDRLDAKAWSIHRVWHDFTKRFHKSDERPRKYIDLDRAELISRVERWARKYPKEVRLVAVDDSYHASSLLVLIEHRSDQTYMGTTVVFIPQCAPDEPSEFFLYPHHRRLLIAALTAISGSARPIEKRERAQHKKDAKRIAKNVQHPPIK